MKKSLHFLFALVLIAGLDSCNKEKKINLGSDYYLMGYKENPASIKLVHGVGDGFEDIILGEIVDYNSNTHDIVVHRKVTEGAKSIFGDLPLWKKQSNVEDQYWIIDKTYDGIIGPLDYKAYLEKRKQLSVSDGLMLSQ